MGVSRRSIRVAGVTVLLSACFAAVAYGMILRPRILLARQIANHGSCQAVDASLRTYFEANHRYPIDLSDAVLSQRQGAKLLSDAWGNKLAYQSDGGTFVLVSYGRDGKPDGNDYRALRALGDHPPGFDICGNYDADEVMSDRGWHRLCGK